MNILLFEKSECDDNGQIMLNDRRYVHLRDTLKSQVGDTLKVGLLNGKLGHAQLISLDDQTATLAVVLDQLPPSPLPLTLIVAMCRPKSLRKVFRYGTAMGIKSFVIIKSWRVDKSYWQTPFLDHDNLHQEFLYALEQCCDTIMPQVVVYKRFKPFVEDVLPGLAADSDMFVAHPYASAHAPYAVQRPVTLAIGPEGGFIPYEVEMFEKAGFTPVTIGSRILRVENAVAALTGRLFI